MDSWGMRRKWVFLAITAIPTVGLALAMLVRSPNGATTETAIQVCLCVAAALSGWYPRASMAVSSALLVVAELMPSIDASEVTLACLVPIGACLVFGRRATAVAGTAAMAVVIVSTEPHGLSAAAVANDVLGWGLMLLLTWTVGLLVGHQVRVNQRLVNEHNEHLERQRAALAQQLHDTVARSNARIALTAESLKSAGLPQEARHQLDLISREAQHNADDLRALLRALRVEEDLPVGRPRRMAEVIAEGTTLLRSQGFTPLIVLPERIEASRGDLMARLLEEAIHNIATHGRPGPCRVLVDESPDGLEVVVANGVDSDGVGTGRPRGARLANGYGLAQVRSEVERAGGWFKAGPSVDGDTWLLTAWLPGIPVEGE